MAHDRLGEIVVDASVEPAPPITKIEQKLCAAADLAAAQPAAAGPSGSR